MQGPTECSDIANPLDTPIPITPAINFHNTLTQDPYNWNFPKKSETMYLSTIRKCFFFKFDFEDFANR